MAQVNAHLAGEALEQLAEGILPTAEVADARAHVEACTRCASELEAYQTLFARLGELPRFAPSTVFADAVMARVELAPQASTMPAWVKRLVPKTRRGWILIGSAAVAPALPLIGLVLLLVSQPLLSLTTLWQWGQLQVQGYAQAGLAWLLDSAVNTGLYSMTGSVVTSMESLPLATVLGAGGFLAVAMPLSAWGLLRLTRTPMGSVNHAS